MRHQNCSFILQLILLFYHVNPVYANDLSILPMPMPTQYHALTDYQQALASWEAVYKNTLVCSLNVQLPALPMPTQYDNLAFYQEALTAWESVSNTASIGDSCTAGNTVVHFVPMPRPTQYHNLDLYQKALAVWKNIYTHTPICRHLRLPPLPMPTQYHNLLLYERALAAWEKAGQCH